VNDRPPSTFLLRRRSVAARLAFCAAALVAAPLVLAPALRAQEQDTVVNCKTAWRQADLNECAWREQARAELRLDAVLGRYRASLPAPLRASFASAQAAWEEFRERDCDLAGSEMEGGSAQPMLEALCRASFSDDRAHELRASAPAAPRGCEGTSGSARGACLAAAYQAADARLNAVYARLRAGLLRERPLTAEIRQHNPDIRYRDELLLASERAWLRYRDAQCGFEAARAGPASADAARTACLVRLTRERTSSLRGTLTDL
jgi:uncharacterized protein YecT (DUF1311 family)